MGNTQSNERQPNYKIYKITGIEKEMPDMVIFELHDYVTYRDGENYKGIFLSKKRCNCKVGDYLEIDLNVVSSEDWCHTFGGDDFSRMIDKRAVRPLKKEWVVEERNSNGDFIRFIRDTVEFFGTMGENRERRYAIMQDARASNYARLRQTSYDMPPKW